MRAPARAVPVSSLLAQIVLLSAWLGAALIVAAAVAPAAFAVLPSRALAGALVGRVLPAIFYAGVAVGAVALVLELLDGGPRWRAARLGGAAVTAIGCGIAQLLVAPRIARLRDAIGPSLDALAADDARRIAFGRLHAMSVGWLALAMVGAVVAVALAVAALRQRG